MIFKWRPPHRALATGWITIELFSEVFTAATRFSQPSKFMEWVFVGRKTLDCSAAAQNSHGLMRQEGNRIPALHFSNERASDENGISRIEFPKLFWADVSSRNVRFTLWNRILSITSDEKTRDYAHKWKRFISHKVFSSLHMAMRNKVNGLRVFAYDSRKPEAIWYLSQTFPRACIRRHVCRWLSSGEIDCW